MNYALCLFRILSLCRLSLRSLSPRHIIAGRLSIATGMLLTSALLCTAWSANAQTALSKSSKIKAAYIFNFTKYIEWPRDAFTHIETPITICVEHNPEFNDFIKALVKQRKVGKDQRSLIVRNINDANICHIAYVKSAEAHTETLLRNALVLSDMNNKHAFSAIIFFRQNDKLRFEINMVEVNRLNITISSELLKLARVK